MKRLEQKRLTIALTQSNRTVSIFYNKEKHKISEITYQPKTFKNTNIVDIKSVITVHPKTSDKLYKTIKQAEKVGSNSSLYSDTKKYSQICKSYKSSSSKNYKS